MARHDSGHHRRVTGHRSSRGPRRRRQGGPRRAHRPRRGRPRAGAGRHRRDAVPSRSPTSPIPSSSPRPSRRSRQSSAPSTSSSPTPASVPTAPSPTSRAEEIERIVRVNVLGTAHAIRAVVPGMIERRRGHIVTIGSIAGRIGSPFEAIYSATKFAGVGLTEALVVELEPYGIGVSMVNPGPVATALRRGPWPSLRPQAARSPCPPSRWPPPSSRPSRAAGTSSTCRASFRARRHHPPPHPADLPVGLASRASPRSSRTDRTKR